MEVAVTAAAILFVVAVLSSCVTPERTWTDADWGKLTQELKHVGG